MIFMAGGNAYSLVHEHKNGWNPEMFRERYSEVLERFDYVVGDWGYNQLRLRGFYRDGHPRASKDSAISSLVDYINEYCNFGCAYFVLAKVDVNALPPDAVISNEESPEARVALNETGGQAAETAAAFSGPILRWPIKERAGGPARVPNVTVSAVARAAAEAEKRMANANSHGEGSAGGRDRGRHGHDSGGHSYRQGRSAPYGGERKPQAQHQGSGQASNKQTRGPRPQHSEHSSGRSAEDHRKFDHPSRQEGPRSEGSRQDNRWQGRNRRRKSFGGKPGPRPEGAAARPDPGTTKSGE
ncbi:YutD-like domain-containing protein [Paenibacillaceae bacterium WGS1546]|uniref:YutD-like domain-containing protein n=1 Tax=Cohnella sp. WGS1546 TaxID=3366810 RepID=UPI00372D6C50